MHVFLIVMVVLTGTVTLRCVNYHFLKVSPSAMMALSAIVASMGVLTIAKFSVGYELHTTLREIQRFLLHGFPDVLVNFVLGYLLFAAAVEVDMRYLGRVKNTVIALAVLSTTTSTVLLGLLSYCLLKPLYPLSLSLCFLFGSIVSPTDPVAVASALSDKPDLIPSSTRYFVLCESLFNDAIAIVLYYGLLNFAMEPDQSFGERVVNIGEIFLRECLGGIIIGLVLAYLAYLLIHSVDESVLEITITVVLVGNIQVACWLLGASSPLASVVAGLLIGNHGVAYSFSQNGITGFHQLWKFIDESLNSILFFVIGLMTLAIEEDARSTNSVAVSNDLGIFGYIMLAIGVIPISLFSRAFSVVVGLGSVLILEKVLGLKLRHPGTKYDIGTVYLLTWGGLRGGLTIALTLSLVGLHLTASVGRVLFCMTYSLVVWSIVGQGLSFEWACKLIQDASFEARSRPGLRTSWSKYVLNTSFATPTASESYYDISTIQGNPFSGKTSITDLAKGGIPYSDESEEQLLAQMLNADDENPVGPGHSRDESLTFDDLPSLKPMIEPSEVAGSFFSILFSSRVAMLPPRSSTIRDQHPHDSESQSQTTATDFART